MPNDDITPKLSARLDILMTEEMKERLKTLAKRDRRDTSEYARLILEDYLAANEEKQH